MNKTDAGTTKSDIIKQHRVGLLYAIAAFGAWGFVPVYWKWISGVSSLSIMSHRVVWASIFLSSCIMFLRQGPELKNILVKRLHFLRLLLGSLLIGANWLIYIYAVQNNHVIESSLGYFLNPLLNIVFGFVLFKEHLNNLQKLAVSFAALGVSYLVISTGGLPWIALSLSFTFAFYGVLRKKMTITGLQATLVETYFLLIPALAYVFIEDRSWMQTSGLNIGLLVGGGVVTAMPLWWFTEAAKRLPLSTLGFCQFIAPTLQFLNGLLLFHEDFNQEKLIAFSFIWAGAGIYLYSMYRSQSTRK